MREEGGHGACQVADQEHEAYGGGARNQSEDRDRQLQDAEGHGDQ